MLSIENRSDTQAVTKQPKISTGHHRRALAAASGSARSQPDTQTDECAPSKNRKTFEKHTPMSLVKKPLT